MQRQKQAEATELQELREVRTRAEPHSNHLLSSIPVDSHSRLILKEIKPEFSSDGLKLKLQHFGHIMGRDDSLEDPDAGKDGGQKENGMTEDEMVG